MRSRVGSVSPVGSADGAVGFLERLVLLQGAAVQLVPDVLQFLAGPGQAGAGEGVLDGLDAQVEDRVQPLLVHVLRDGVVLVGIGTYRERAFALQFGQEIFELPHIVIAVCHFDCLTAREPRLPSLLPISPVMKDPHHERSGRRVDRAHFMRALSRHPHLAVFDATDTALQAHQARPALYSKQWLP